MEVTEKALSVREAPLSVVILGVVVVLYAMAWYGLYVFIAGDITLKALATPFFIVHVLLGVGLIKGWNWARQLVIAIASFGLLATLILVIFRGQTDLFILYLVVLFLSALVILLRSAAREYFLTAQVAETEIEIAHDAGTPADILE